MKGCNFTMKVLLSSYNTVAQNVSGGIQVTISKIKRELIGRNIEVKLFNKWEDKVTDFDILHIFKLSIDDFGLISYAKNNNVPVIISSIIPVHNSLKIIYNLTINKLLKINSPYSLYKKMLDMSDAIIVQTNQELKFLKKIFNIDIGKLYVIPNGIDVKSFNKPNNLISDSLGINNDFVLQVGRFDKNKNQLNLIRAMKGTGIPVVFIGGAESSEIEYYHKCIEEANEDFYFLGWLNHSSPLLASAYNEAKVVALPSYSETFGNVLLEGGLAGANLVASESLPILETRLGEVCRKINPYKIESIKDGILEAINLPRSPKIRELIINEYSWDSVIKQYIDVYEHCGK